MKTFKKALIAAAAIIGMQAAPSAMAAAVFTFSNTGLTRDVAVGGGAGTKTFSADKIVLTSQGLATITITDNTAPFGFIGAADTFAEFGFVAAVNFRNGGSGVTAAASGLGTEYELFAKYTLTGTVGLVGPNIVANMTGGNAQIFYDTNVNGSLDGANVIANLGSPVTGDCAITAASTFTQGSCKINYDFAAGGPAGTWKYGAIDASTVLNDFLTLDINVDNLLVQGGFVLPFLNPNGDTVLTADHDGSAVINLPEPASLALVGLGLMAAGAARRRKA